jgi:ribose transport system substrate-binding protein
MNRLAYSIVLLCFTASALFAFNGCQSKRSGGHKKIAIIISTSNIPCVFLGENAAAKAKDIGYETKIFCSQNNTALETDHVETPMNPMLSLRLLAALRFQKEEECC